MILGLFNSVMAQDNNGSALFKQKCAVCHTIGGGAKAGPDLMAVSNWAESGIRQNVVRMQSKAGQLSQSEIDNLVLYLKTESQSVAKNAGSSAVIQLPGDNNLPGCNLFSGSKPFLNGGPSCISCHSINGGGGAPGLNKIARHGYKCANTSFLLNPHNSAMANAYGNNPVTPNEARLIGSYLNSIPQSFSVKHHHHHHHHHNDDDDGYDDD